MGFCLGCSGVWCSRGSGHYLGKRHGPGILKQSQPTLREIQRPQEKKTGQKIEKKESLEDLKSHTKSSVHILNIISTNTTRNSKAAAEKDRLENKKSGL